MHFVRTLPGTGGARWWMKMQPDVGGMAVPSRQARDKGTQREPEQPEEPRLPWVWGEAQEGGRVEEQNL